MIISDRDFEVPKSGLLNRDMVYWVKAKTHEERYLEVFGKNFPDLNGSYVLDIGCSEGDNTRSMARNYPQARIVGIDIVGERISCAKACAKAENLENVVFQNEDVYDVRLPSNSFDVVLALNNLWYVTFQNTGMTRAQMLQTYWAFTRLTAPRGFFILSSHKDGVVFRKSDSKYEIQGVFLSGVKVDLDSADKKYLGMISRIEKLMPSVASERVLATSLQ